MNKLHKEFQLRELKFDGASEDMTFSGYGAVFGNVDAYGDVIAPGAFADSLAKAQETGRYPAMLAQHDAWENPVGVWTTLAEDGTGLKVEGKLADTPKGRELYALMKMTPRPAIDGLSIGFRPVEWSMREKPEDPRRTLKKIDLVEVSIVTMPANERARVAAVKNIDDFETLTDVEHYLREAGGFSRSEVKHLISKIKSLNPRDAGDVQGLAAALARNAQLVRNR